jgi:NADPH:quinone reductase
MVKTARVHAYGGPEVIRIDELPPPVPPSGHVLVAVKAAGINFFDTQLRSGLYRRFSLPVSLGLEGAGIVEGIGPDVADLAIGDRICWIMSPGSYATHAVVPVAKTAKLPAALDFDRAAAGIYQGMTAHYLADSVFPLGSGHICIVHSAAGGVGQLLSQIAKRRGATVIGTVSSEEKAPMARAAGADHVIVYTNAKLTDEARRLTDGRGVDVVYDAVGLETYEASLASLKPRGLLALYGEASGLVPPIDVRSLLSQGSCTLTRVGLEHFIETRSEFLRRANDILQWLANGTLRVHVDQTFALADVAAAHRAIESRARVGKVLLRP